MMPRHVFQHEKQVGKIHTADQKPDRRHDNVFDQRVDNLAESGADNDTDSHVYHVAAHGKFFKFVKKRPQHNDSPAVYPSSFIRGKNKFRLSFSLRRNTPTAPQASFLVSAA